MRLPFLLLLAFMALNTCSALSARDALNGIFSIFAPEIEEKPSDAKDRVFAEEERETASNGLSGPPPHQEAARMARYITHRSSKLF